MTADPTRRLTEIEQRLEKATPGEWRSTNDAVPFNTKHKSPFIEQGVSIIIEGLHNDHYIVEGGKQDEQGGAVGVLRNEDAEFIENAKPDLAFLLSEIRALQEESFCNAVGADVYKRERDEANARTLAVYDECAAITLEQVKFYDRGTPFRGPLTLAQVRERILAAKQKAGG